MGRVLYAGLTELRGRVRAELLNDIADFDRDGNPDPMVLTRYFIPASQDIDSALGDTRSGVYATPFLAPFPEEVVELALDGVLWRLGMWNPTVIVIDHAALKKDVMDRLKMIRTGKFSIGGSAGAPNIHGGAVTPPPNTQQGNPFFIPSPGNPNPWGIF